MSPQPQLYVNKCQRFKVLFNLVGQKLSPSVGENQWERVGAKNRE